LADIIAASRALLEGGPRPAPRLAGAPRPARRSLIAGSALVVAAAALAGAIGLRKEICDASGLLCPGGAASPPKSLAVLPFDNLSGDPSQAYFCEGLSEELLDRLAHVPQLQVAGRTSAFKFKGGKDDAATIGAKLGVAYILDGSVRRSDTVVRVSAQLIEAKTGFERWSQSYDRDLRDVFAVQDDIAASVTQALKLKLLGGTAAAAPGARETRVPAAHDAYLQGRKLFDSSAGEAALRGAIAKFDAAIGADPTYAAPWSGKARALLALASQFAPDSEVKIDFDAALAAARKAAALDPSAAEPQLAIGEILLNTHLNFAEAQPYYDRAMQRDGGAADLLVVAGLFACRRGDFARGLSALRKASALDPLNPRAFKALSLGLTAARGYPEAIDAARKVLALSPAATGAHGAIGFALHLLGRDAQALDEFDAEPTDFLKLSGRAIVLRALGKPAQAQAALDTLVAGGSLFTYQVAEVRAQWGDIAGALAALRTAFVAGDTGVLRMMTDPLLDPLRTSPDYRALVARLGLDV
jgi:serine/threonine-protein kinase